jgi:C4-dicarboxylate-specific signal transduction histidine kinase
LRMPDGSIKYLHAIAHATRDQDGELEYIAAVQDVTGRRLSEEALDKARSELARVSRISSLGVLTASIAHEINQPLAGILTNASTCLRKLAADPPNVEGARETARRTIRDGNRASEVIARLRALFTKRESTTELLDLNEATREVVALSSSDLQRNRVILRQELADDLPPVVGDRVQLQQVILNLIRNASDAMSDVDDRPRHLLITTELDEGSHVRLAVRDAGVGLEPQSVNRLFEAFYSTKTNGMGIGLSVSRTIIESHYGRLWAVPNDDGPGATFSFSIPRRLERVTGADTLAAIRTPAATNAQRLMRSS